MRNVLEARRKESDYVVRGARLSCKLGSVDSKLLMIKSHGVFLRNKPQCNINDRIPMKNIMSFGVCKIFKPPPPCIPITLKPWVNKKDVPLLINGIPALITGAKCFCKRGGVISIKSSGQ